jgi:hypothetical protein
MKLRWEILIGAALIAASIAWVGRWQISGIPGERIVAYRLDRWSGTIDYCILDAPKEAAASEYVAQLDRAGAVHVSCVRPTR